MNGDKCISSLPNILGRPTRMVSPIAFAVATTRQLRKSLPRDETYRGLDISLCMVALSFCNVDHSLSNFFPIHFSLCKSNVDKP